MHYFIILTKECNLFCSYCGGGSDTPPREIQYSIDDLGLSSPRTATPSSSSTAASPSSAPRRWRRSWTPSLARFVVQTNGIFLDRIEPEHLAKLHSHPGLHRRDAGGHGQGAGKRVYERVVRNAELVRQRGFRGDLVARMTVEQGTDIHENVNHLLRTGLFDHVHWQLSFSMFWDAGEQTAPGLEEWTARYNSGVSALVGEWVDEMSRSGRVLGIVPFLAVMGSLLSGERSRLRCGSGIDFFSVMPDGRISACPVSIDYDFSIVGSISESTPQTASRQRPGGGALHSPATYSTSAEADASS